VPLAATLPPLVAAHAARSFLLVPRRRPRWQPPALLAASPPPLAAPHADCRPAAGRRPRRRPPPRRRLPPPTPRSAATPVAGCRHGRSPALVVVSAPSLPAAPQAGSRPLHWLMAASPRSRFAANAGFRPAADSGPSRWLPPCRRSAPPTLPDAAAPAAGCRRRCLWPLLWLPPPCRPRPLTLAAASTAGHRRCWLPPSGRPPLSTLAATPSLATVGAIACRLAAGRPSPRWLPRRRSPPPTLMAVPCSSLGAAHTGGRPRHCPPRPPLPAAARRAPPPTLLAAAAPAAGCRRRRSLRLLWLSPPHCPRRPTLAAARATGHGPRQWVPPHCWSPPPFGRPSVPVTV